MNGEHIIVWEKRDSSISPLIIQKNFVNPITGKHSQLIECLWGIAKNKIMRAMRGTTTKNMQGHLSEHWFRSITSKDSSIVFENILKLYKSHYDNTLKEN